MMPLYEYKCRRCEAEFELLIRGAEKPLCPHCDGDSLEKLLSIPAAHVASSGSLPICGVPGPGMCGMGGCGSGGCPIE